MDKFIRSGSLTGFPEVARQFGLDPLRLMREFGLPRGCLAEPDTMIPVDPVGRLMDAAALRSGVESFGLQMAEARKVTSLGPLGLFAREQPTLRDALAALAHYARLLNEALAVQVEETEDVAIVRENLHVRPDTPVRQATELAVALVVKTMRSFLGADWKPRRVCFMHGPPADPAVHLHVFGRNVSFDAEFNGIVLLRRELDVANEDADPTLARYAHQLLETHLLPGEDALADRVRQLVVLQLGSGQCTVDRIAQMLRVDRRTVHRRLLQEQQSFSDIVDSVRSDLAARYLADRRRTLAEISVLLGFAAPSGFTRWYRRRFGHAPSLARNPRRPPDAKDAISR